MEKLQIDIIELQQGTIRDLNHNRKLDEVVVKELIQKYQDLNVKKDKLFDESLFEPLNSIIYKYEKIIANYKKYFSYNLKRWYEVAEQN